MSTNKALSRNLLSLDDKLWTIEAVTDFNASGASVLKQWQPSQTGSSAGDYVNAPLGGCEGVIGVFKRGTGDYRLVLQDSYVRLKGFEATYENSAHLGVAAPDVTNFAGKLTTGSLTDGTLAADYPDCTSYTVEVLEAGHSGVSVAAAQPTFIVAGATFPSTVIGMTFTDSAGVSATILDASGTTITLSGTATPATGAGWSITAGTVVVLNASILSGARSSTAFIKATFTDGAATWLVNRWAGHYLRDDAGNTFRIVSNTATVLSLAPVGLTSQYPTTEISGMTGTSTGSVFTVTAGGPTVSAGAYVGMIFSDGTNDFLIVANSALTATTGTITVVGSPAGTVTATGSVLSFINGPVSGSYRIEQGFSPGPGGEPTQYSVTGPQITGVASTGTGTANTWTVSSHTNWVAGIFAGMWLIDSAGVYWLITANTTSALTVASNGSSTTPTTGTSWSIVSVAGSASIEFSTQALSGTASGLTLTMDSYTPAGTNGTGALTATAAAQTFTGTAGTAVVNNTPAFTGTGYAVAGQVITTTDNQTMTLNQCAGMFFMSDSGDVVEIVSNTAVTGAPAVLTVVGKAVTDAGGYTIFKGVTPAGTNGTSAVTGTAAAEVFTGTPHVLTGTVTGTVAVTAPTPTSPAAGERLLLSVLLSDGSVQG